MNEIINMKNVEILWQDFFLSKWKCERNWNILMKKVSCWMRFLYGVNDYTCSTIMRNFLGIQFSII